MKNLTLLVITAIGVIASSPAFAIGSARVECRSKNVSVDLFVPYRSFSKDKIQAFRGQINFFGEQIQFSQLDNLNHLREPIVLLKKIREDGVDQYDYDFLGGSQILSKTGIYKFRLSIFRDHMEVYAVDGNVNIEARGLLEEGECLVLGVNGTGFAVF